MIFRWIAVLALWGGSAAAQDWADVDVCHVDTAEVVSEVYEPAGLAKLQAAAAQIPNGVGKFWRITAPNGAVSHLWGTMHVTHPLILNLPDIVVETVQSSRLVMTEIDFVFKDRAAYRAAQDYPGRFNLSPDIQLLPPTTVMGLAPDVSTWVRDRFVELGMSEDGPEYLTPGGLAEFLLAAPCEDFAAGVYPVQDDYIALLARLAGVPVRGLEDANEFVRDLNRPEMYETARALVGVYGTYLKPVNSNANRKTFFAHYLSGQLGLDMALDRSHVVDVLGPEGDTMFTTANDYILTTRNERWIQRLKTELSFGGTFVAVGAYHLPGHGGLVELLRVAGYKVARVPVAGEAR